MDPNTKFKNIDEYISAYPENVQILLEQLRAVIKKTAPEAEEVISYNMPAFKLKVILVYFAAHKEQIGILNFYYFSNFNRIAGYQFHKINSTCKVTKINLYPGVYYLLPD
jgi:uncharacterized protein YdhG (YjbR/CyaY superfamily)